MKRLNTSPISGMQELLPASQAVFDKIKGRIGEVYHRHGFVSIETPIIDRTDILLAKAGGDTEKQIYKVVKTAEAAEGADQALRFDHTVPLARYVVEHENDLTFPFKVTQIGRNFRGERAQKGRYREFYQCDVDVIGRGNLPIYYDADIILTLLDAYSSFELSTPVRARVSNRKILTGAIEALNLQGKSGEIYNIIDHAEKVPREKTEAAFDAIGVNANAKEKILALIDIAGPVNEVSAKLTELGLTNETFEAGIKELTEVLELVESASTAGAVVADMKIVRGLDYYTGTVFEFMLPEYPEVGSVGGGGRYENLAGYFTDQILPGVGGSIGLTRLFYVLSEKGLLRDGLMQPVEVAVVPISDAELKYAVKVACELRAAGQSVTLVAGDKKLGDKMKYASKVAQAAIVIGENEVKTGKYQVKRFE
ncbi:histidine--tRNA ligase [Candidatus Saccharibacteria bacterium]|nr:histidine--tRNA ligase [Candidatus Saccharibacteria bacterium]